MKSNSHQGGLVYSTELGRTCPKCRQALASCLCSATSVRPAVDGVLRVSMETKGRAGKGVTVVRGLALDATAIVALGKQLRTSCGSGGTVKDGVVEVQGDHRDRVIKMLTDRGHVVKRTGS